jgi:hypothetical protein
MKFWESQRGGPWHLPAGRIAEFNRFLRGSGPLINRGPSPQSSFTRRYELTCIRTWPREASMKRAMIIVTLWWLAF